MAPPELQTERLILRPAARADVPAVLEYYRANEGHFAATSGTQPEGFKNSEFWLQRLEKWQQDFENGLSARFFLFDRGPGREVIGTANLTEFVRGQFQACYLGYGIGAKQEGRGLMTEGLRAVIEYAFQDLNLHRIMANHLPENERSARVLARLGFTREGYAKEYLRIGGAWRDHVLNSLTNRDWAPVK